MSDKQLQDCIKGQAEVLLKRAEWFQRMIDRQSQVQLNSQQAIEKFTADLEATNLAIDALRTEYKSLCGTTQSDKQHG